MSMVESPDKIYRWVWWNLLIRSTDEYGGISLWDLQMSMVKYLDEIYRWVWWNLLMRSTDEYGRISWWDLQMNMVRSNLISQSCPEDGNPVLVNPHDLFFTMSHWSILVFWLLHILGVSIERRWSFRMSKRSWPDYMNKLEIIELLLINTLAAPRPQ